MLKELIITYDPEKGVRFWQGLYDLDEGLEYIPEEDDLSIIEAIRARLELLELELKSDSDGRRIIE